MMSSSWKISVFGIVALMLAFGLVTDALAQKTATITILYESHRGTARGRQSDFTKFTVTLAEEVDWVRSGSTQRTTQAEFNQDYPSGRMDQTH